MQTLLILTGIGVLVALASLAHAIKQINDMLGDDYE